MLIAVPPSSLDSKQRPLMVFIGRFSPFHIGHAEVLKRALTLSEKVLVIVGSANQPRTTKNPWTAAERGKMIWDWYESYLIANGWNTEPQRSKLVIESNRDYMYNNQLWLQATEALIKKHEPSKNVWITGANRDASTFYLQELETFGYTLDLVQDDRSVSQFLTATGIREMFFGETWNGQKMSEPQLDVLMKSLLPPTTLQFLWRFRGTPECANLVNEYNVILKRLIAKRSGKYEVIDQTIDAVVIQTGHVCLVKRRAAPGKGLWAIPGGHLEPDEWMLDGAVRELYEETQMDVPEKVLRGSMLFSETFEHPQRSQLGRVISKAFCFKLNDFMWDGKIVLPKVTGSDDAEYAKWFTLSEALSMSDRLFDDHHAILETFVGRLPVDKR